MSIHIEVTLQIIYNKGEHFWLRIEFLPLENVVRTNTYIYDEGYLMNYIQ